MIFQKKGVGCFARQRVPCHCDCVSRGWRLACQHRRGGGSDFQGWPGLREPTQPAARDRAVSEPAGTWVLPTSSEAVCLNRSSGDGRGRRARGGSRRGRMPCAASSLREQSPDHVRSPGTRGSRAARLEAEVALRMRPRDAGLALRAAVHRYCASCGRGRVFHGLL